MSSPEEEYRAAGVALVAVIRRTSRRAVVIIALGAITVSAGVALLAGGLSWLGAIVIGLGMAGVGSGSYLLGQVRGIAAASMMIARELE